MDGRGEMGCRAASAANTEGKYYAGYPSLHAYQSNDHVTLIMDDVIKINVNSTAGKGGLVMGSNQLASASHVADWLGCTFRGVQAVQKEEG